MKDNINKLIIFTYCIVLLFSLISCNNTAPGLQSQPWSSGESSETTSVVKSSSEKEDLSGKDDLWANKKLTVGYVSPGASHSWNAVLTKSLQDASKDWNVLLHVKGDTANDNQIVILNEFIEKDTDIIALCATQLSGWNEIVDSINNADIPLVLIERDIECNNESIISLNITPDYYKEGEMAGEWLSEYLEKEGKLEEINISEISGMEELNVVQKIGNGFREAIKETSNIEITISRDGYFTQSGGYEVMKQILLETKDIDVLFCHNDDMALGAIQAIEEAGLVPGEDIIIVSIMGTNAALEAIVEGKIACSVECNPLMGDLFMEACVRLANGETIEREIHPVDRVFDITNAQAELDAREENGYGY